MKPIIDHSAVYSVGCYDNTLDLFESQYVVPDGVCYNSYVILDEKVAILDTVDPRKTDEWLENLDETLGNRTPDYLVIHHMEPDHAGSVKLLVNRYPDIKLVGNAKTFPMLTQFTGIDFSDRAMIVKEKDVLDLGAHSLCFYMAPMVHWPEAMVSLEEKESILFSADGFGRFGGPDPKQPWLDEARRYYTNIVGKYGTPVQALLKKVGGEQIRLICPLHGCILSGEAVGEAVAVYDKWSRYEPEEQGVLVAYASIHGNTAQAALELTEMLRQAGVKAMSFDLTRGDWAEAVAQAFRWSGMVLAASSYDAGVFTPMAQFLYRLKIKALQNRVVGLVENGSWGPTALKTMEGALVELKDFTIVEPKVSIRSGLNEAGREQLKALAAAMAEAVGKEKC